ncbi:DUF6287 domain-containing protein [Streptococcus merionis]|uniref:Lipoprotein n=1 Tax=Streptococcus merionis TaxID=400065 RepID=A0A239SPI3_9STRE|nr:DUF6287 domain-containing protein [Streptococcus merionis]SNU87172.1 lipoprotein [Streptococcus merionis]
MKHKTVLKSLALLSTLFIITACSNGKQNTESSSTSVSKSSQTTTTKSTSTKNTSSSQKKSEVASSSAKSASGSSSSSKASSSSSSANTPSSSETKPAASTTAFDLKAIEAGDFSSVAGTWKNDDGMTFVLNKSGLVSKTSSLTFLSNQNGVLHFNMASSYGGGAAFMIVPKGASAPGGTTYLEDALVAGQSATDEDHPFYKVSSSTTLVEEPASPSSVYLAVDTNVYVQPDRSAEVAFTYPAGNTVNWDRFFESNGENWYSYVSHEGIRYYIPHSDTYQ